jgi:hypothetical protein
MRGGIAWCTDDEFIRYARLRGDRPQSPLLPVVVWYTAAPLRAPVAGSVAKSVRVAPANARLFE